MADRTVAQSQSPTDEGATIYSLLSAERKIATKLWTILNEMRGRGELPDWVKESFPDAGTSKQAEAMRAAQDSVNGALKGDLPAVRFRLGETLDSHEFSLTTNEALPRLIFEGSAIDLACAVDLRELTPRQLQMMALGVREQAARMKDQLGDECCV